MRSRREIEDKLAEYEKLLAVAQDKQRRGTNLTALSDLLAVCHKLDTITALEWVLERSKQL